MPVQRRPGTDYPRHTIEDRPEIPDTLKLVDDDGSVVDVGANNPVTTTSSTSDLDRNSEEIVLLEEISMKLSELIKYAKEALDGEVL